MLLTYFLNDFEMVPVAPIIIIIIIIIVVVVVSSSSYCRTTSAYVFPWI